MFKRCIGYLTADAISRSTQRVRRYSQDCIRSRVVAYFVHKLPALVGHRLFDGLDARYRDRTDSDRCATGAAACPLNLPGARHQQRGDIL